MLRHVLFEVSIFSGEDEGAGQKDLLWLLEALTRRDQTILRDDPSIPPIYKSGIKYIRPQQFDGECEEIAVLKEALGPKAKDPKVKATLATVRSMIGGERFRDVKRIIENGGGDCFPLSQKIIVRSKSTGCYEILALGDLRLAYEGYEALSYNLSTCKYEFKNIVGFVDKGVKPVSKARLSNGTDLIATNDHKFWSLDGSRRCLSLNVRTMGEYVEDCQNFRRGKLSKGARTSRARIVQATRIPALAATSPSKALAYLAGMYAAEGEHSDGKHTRIGQHKEGFRKKIESALAEVGTSFHYAPGRGATPGSGAQYSLHGGAANPVVAMMRQQGSNSFDKHLPQSFLSADAETVRAMIVGHGDGDAWRPANGTFKRPGVEAVYATSSDRLMEQLRLGLLVGGQPFYAYRYEQHGGSGDKPIWRLHEYNENATKLQSRAEILSEDLPGLRYGTVRDAQPFGEAHVGCIEVEGNHNFFLSDGTLVSNCDNVASWRAAELRNAGINAMPYITWRKRADGGTTYHVIVRWPDGSSEDPSLILGMGGEERKAERDEEIRKNQERMELAQQALLINSAVNSLDPETYVDILEGLLRS